MIKNISLNLEKRASCKQRCTIQSNCVSINIGPSVNDKFLCQLSDSDHIRHPDDLKPREGFLYRGTEVRNLVSVGELFLDVHHYRYRYRYHYQLSLSLLLKLLLFL